MRRGAIILWILLAASGCEPRVVESSAQLFPEIENMICVRGSGSVRSFLIDCYEVTNDGFAEFLRRSHYQPDQPAGFLLSWWLEEDLSRRPPAGKLEHPVTDVSYADAEAYARFWGKRLPTKREWERAAAPAGGATFGIYPWGTPNFYRYYCNVLSTGIGDTTPVGTFPSGSTEADGRGCHDMAGNVWEWIAVDPDDPLDPPFDANNLEGGGRSLLERSLPQSDVPDSDFRRAYLPDWTMRVIKGGSFRERGTDWAQIVPYKITAGRERVEDPKCVSAEARVFDLGFRCVRDAEPFVDHVLDKLASVATHQVTQAGRELMALGDDFWDLLGARDQQRREVPFSHQPELIESLFPVTARDRRQEVVLVTESGMVRRLGPNGELRFNVDARAGWHTSLSAQPTAALPLGLDRMAVCWRASTAADVAPQVGFTLLAIDTGRSIRTHVGSGEEIAVLPATNSLALVMVNRVTWLARAFPWLQRLAEPWSEFFAAEWQRFRDVASAGYEPWSSSWRTPLGAAIVASREELFDFDDRWPSHQPFTEITELTLVRLADGEVTDRHVVWAHLDLPDPGDAEGRSVPGAAHAWLLDAARADDQPAQSSSIMRVRVGDADRGKLSVEALRPIDARGLPLQFVPSDVTADQGRLVLLGPTPEGVLTLAALTDAGALVERWSRPVFAMSPVLTSVQLVRPGKLLLGVRERGEGRSYLVSLANGGAIELDALGAPCLVSEAHQQTWISFAGLPGIPRGLAYCRAEAAAPLHYFRVDTLGARHILFDATGKGDLRLLLSRGTSLQCYDMTPRNEPLDQLLQVFWRERSTAVAHARP